MITGNIDIFMISEKKLGETFTVARFWIPTNFIVIAMVAVLCSIL